MPIVNFVCEWIAEIVITSTTKLKLKYDFPQLKYCLKIVTDLKFISDSLKYSYSWKSVLIIALTYCLISTYWVKYKTIWSDILS